MNFTLCSINNEVLQEACVCLVRVFPFGSVISSWLVTNAVLRSNG